MASATVSRAALEHNASTVPLLNNKHLPCLHVLRIKDLSSEQRDSYVNFTRLLTYFGMCVATCVIFQSSTHIAWGCIVGAAVAVYIAASEYWLNSAAEGGGHKPEIDTKQLEELIMKSL